MATNCGLPVVLQHNKPDKPTHMSEVPSNNIPTKLTEVRSILMYGRSSNPYSIASILKQLFAVATLNFKQCTDVSNFVKSSSH
jgi:hypothetical protein